jgi:hypothetical protein
MQPRSPRQRSRKAAHRVMNLWVIPTMAILALPAPSWSQFREPVLTNIASGLGSDWGATFSSDMLEVYWIADLLDGRDDFDVWWARRESIDAPWQNSQPLDIVNSNRTENMPHLSYDGLTLTFSSFGREGG